MSQRVGPGTGRKRGHQHHPRNQGTRRAPVPTATAPTLLNTPSASQENNNVIDLTACDDEEEAPQTIKKPPAEDMSLVFRPAAEGSSQSDQEAEEDPELEELARLRCTSERTEVVAERETRRRNRRCADYPGLAFGSSIFSSDTLMKFSIIRNELHNIMNTQLKRVRVLRRTMRVIFGLGIARWVRCQQGAVLFFEVKRSGTFFKAYLLTTNHAQKIALSSFCWANEYSNYLFVPVCDEINVYLAMRNFSGHSHARFVLALSLGTLLIYCFDNTAIPTLK